MNSVSNLYTIFQILIQEIDPLLELYNKVLDPEQFSELSPEKCPEIFSDRIKYLQHPPKGIKSLDTKHVKQV